jgi:hypothetical protein
VYQKLMTLLESLGDLPGRPADLGGFLAAAATAGARPLPQHAWTLIGLLHYQDRKWWAWEAYQAHVRPLVRDGDAPGAAAAPDWACAGRGIVPGLPDWEFELDGNASFLAHRGTGEKIHVDVVNGPEDMNAWGFHEFVETHREPGPAERRLRQLFPGGGGLRLALRDLTRARLIHALDAPNFELCPVVTDHVDGVAGFLGRWEDPVERLPLAALIGDWAAAHETVQALGRTDLTAVTGPRAERCRQRWLQRLRKRAARVGLDGDILCALAHAGAEGLPRYLEQALDNPDTVATATRLFRDDPAWCPRVFALLLRGPQPDGMECFNHEACARYLGRHHFQVRAVIDYLLTEDRPRWDVIIELAAADDRDRLPRFLREGLGANWPEHRLTAAAALALIDTPWSRRLLRSVLTRSRNPDRTVEARAALRLSRDARAVRAVDRWEAEHPEEAEAPLTSDRSWHMVHGGCEPRLRAKMDKLRDRVLVRGADTRGSQMGDAGSPG